MLAPESRMRARHRNLAPFGPKRHCAAEGIAGVLSITNCAGAKPLLKLTPSIAHWEVNGRQREIHDALKCATPGHRHWRICGYRIRTRENMRTKRLWPPHGRRSAETYAGCGRVPPARGG